MLSNLADKTFQTLYMVKIHESVTFITNVITLHNYVTFIYIENRISWVKSKSARVVQIPKHLKSNKIYVYIQWISIIGGYFVLKCMSIMNRTFHHKMELIEEWHFWKRVATIEFNWIFSSFSRSLRKSHSQS